MFKLRKGRESKKNQKESRNEDSHKLSKNRMTVEKALSGSSIPACDGLFVSSLEKRWIHASTS
jgi:hypothetical protein